MVPSMDESKAVIAGTNSFLQALKPSASHGSTGMVKCLRSLTLTVSDSFSTSSVGGTPPDAGGWRGEALEDLSTDLLLRLAAVLGGVAALGACWQSSPEEHSSSLSSDSSSSSSKSWSS